MQPEAPEAGDSASGTGNIAGAGCGLGCIGIALVFIGTGLPNLPVFIDPPSAAITFGISCGMLLCAYGFRGVSAMYWNILWRSAENSDPARLKLTAHAMRFLGMAVMVAGVLGHFIGVINMLKAGMDDPNALAQDIVISLLTVFYGLIGLLLFTSMAARAESLLEHHSAENPEAGSVNEKAIGFSLLVTILSMIALGFFWELIQAGTEPDKSPDQPVIEQRIELRE